MISCQLALYPLATADFERVILDSLDSIKTFEAKGLVIEVGSISTVIKGTDQLVWQAVRVLFEQASKNGQQIVLNAQFSNECGCELK